MSIKYSYDEFLKRKVVMAEKLGFDVDLSEINQLLKPHQKDIVRWMVSMGRAACFAAFGLGKCHGAGTKILMHDCSIKNVEDIKVGDQIMGDDGSPRNVLSLARGKEQMYRIILKNGDNYTCNESHILSLCVSNKFGDYVKGDIVSMSLHDWLKLPEWAKKNCFKHYKSKIDWDHSDVTLDPYLYGAWLGDGHYKSLSWTINDKDSAISNRIKEFASKKDLNIREQKESGCSTFFLTRKIRGRREHCKEFYFVQENGKNGKRICKDYLINSREVRLQLLAGLIDTDGHVIDKCYEIVTKWIDLRDDILFLCRSLGFSVSHREKIVNDVTYYRVWISGNTSEIPCLTRKKCEARKQIKNPLVYGFDVEPLGVGDYFGFEIDGNHLYLLNDFTVTHNTFIQLEVLKLTLKNCGGKGLIVIPLGVRQEFVRDAEMLGIPVKFVRRNADAVEDGIYLTNYESVRDGKLDPREFNVASLDEAACLRGMGGTKTFREFMALFAGDRKTMDNRILGESVKYRFVATATPSPNEYIELLAYSAFLGVMDVGQSKTRFFKRDSTKADKLTLHAHKEEEFWLWVASWGLFVQKPSDLGHSDEGYALPELEIHWHEIPNNHEEAGFDFRGQGLLVKEQAIGIVESAKEKRDSLPKRICKLKNIIENYRNEFLEKNNNEEDAERIKQRILRIKQGQIEKRSACQISQKQGSKESIHEAVSENLQKADLISREERGTKQEEEREICKRSGIQGTIQNACEELGETESRKEESLKVKGGLWFRARPIRENTGRTKWWMCDLRRSNNRGRREEQGREEIICGSLSCDRKDTGIALSSLQLRDRSFQGRSRSSTESDSLPDQIVIWCDLNEEQKAVEKMLKSIRVSYSSFYGNQDIDQKIKMIEEWKKKNTSVFLSKSIMHGSGVNLQQCHTMVFVGINYKANDFMQAIHRIHRFLQKEKCHIHLIYTESEREVRRILEEKWAKHKLTVGKMTEIIKQYGLSNAAMAEKLQRSMGVERIEVAGRNYTVVNNDSVKEMEKLKENSVDLILTSIPFSTQYEYSPNYADFGHSDNNAHFFEQMDYLTPNLLRALKPGRVAVIHVKDRIVPGGLTGLGYQTVYPFHAETIRHYQSHGFGYMGMITVVTDVVRENNQTYRLGWSEVCKDSSKISCGMPEYLLIFRKTPTDTSNAYADEPVTKTKEQYSRSRWQTDAHGFWRSNGNRNLTPEELETLDHDVIFKWFRDHNLENVYDYEHHVKIGETIDGYGRLPVTFMLLQTPSWMPDVWTDVARMRTLNMIQAQKGKEMHLCPMQFDIADRIIERFTNPGELVLDPFSGIGSVGYRALLKNRKYYGIELSPRYFSDSCYYLESAEKEMMTPDLFGFLPAVNG